MTARSTRSSSRTSSGTWSCSSEPTALCPPRASARDPMFEILDRGGLGRTGTWIRGGREIRTPTVLSVHRPHRAAPEYAEALLVAERTTDPRLQIRVSGSFFSERPPEDPDDLPATKAVPLSVADLEIPTPFLLGDLAVVTSGADFAAAASADAGGLSAGPPRHPAPRRLASGGWALAPWSRIVLDSARGVFHTPDGAYPDRADLRAACACPACAGGE